MNLLVVIDMQNDFVDGALGTPEAEAIVDAAAAEIRGWDGPVICTRDTHAEDYADTQEGRKLPVPHCVSGSHGWELNKKIAGAATDKNAIIIDKPSFGSLELADVIKNISNEAGRAGDRLKSIELIGICTDICVISNALILKAAFPELPISVKADCCAGVTPASHDNALSSMAACQIDIV